VAGLASASLGIHRVSVCAINVCSAVSVSAAASVTVFGSGFTDFQCSASVEALLPSTSFGPTHMHDSVLMLGMCKVLFFFVAYGLCS
jgi:hypothetical protein